MSKPQKSSVLSALNGLGWPLIVGLAMASMFYILVLEGPLHTPVLMRYFAEHPVSYCATIMFFVGMAALGIKLLEVAGQFSRLDKTQQLLAIEVPEISSCASYLEQLAQLPAKIRTSYLARRFHDAVQFLVRKDNATGLDDELKYLADMDAARQQESYSLVRIITWATPMLGFLGTVVGITKALGDLGAQSELLATEPQAAMQSLLSGLYVAFDTTALALTLSIVLMFVQFLVDRAETQLLSLVDQIVGRELTGRFEQEELDSDPHLAVMQRMGTAVVKTVEQLIRQQTDLWENTIVQANQSWSETLATSGNTLQGQLSESLENSLDQFSSRIASTVEKSDNQLRERWEQWQVALSDNARLMQAQQAEMVRQGEIMTRAVEVTGDVIKLEQALNQNLQALSGSKNFEDTVMSLSAAIQLLSTRVGYNRNDSGVQLEQNDSLESEGRAA